MKAWTFDNVRLVENKSGNYYFYDSRRRFIYVGISTILRHRLLSYMEKDDFKEHRTKRLLRSKIRYFSIKYRPISLAREIEHRIKHKAPYNYQKKGQKPTWRP